MKNDQSRTPSSRRKLASMYREAARLMEEAGGGDNFNVSNGYVGARYSCIALQVAAETLGGSYGDHNSMMAQADYRKWFGKNGSFAFGLSTDDDNFNHRVISLCMMAAITERP